jgi:hypothetical protein
MTKVILEPRGSGSTAVQPTDFRARLLDLAAALDASEKGLCRDECGDWGLYGNDGHIYVDGDGFLLVVSGRSARAWTWAKRRLSFCRVTQDGDDEGCLHLDRLPVADEADEIRDILGIRKRRSLSPETLAALNDQIADIQARKRAEATRPSPPVDLPPLKASVVVDYRTPESQDVTTEPVSERRPLSWGPVEASWAESAVQVPPVVWRPRVNGTKKESSKRHLATKVTSTLLKPRAIPSSKSGQRAIRRPV